MLKFLLQPYLLACYCFAKFGIKKKEQWRIPEAVAYVFSTPIIFLLYGTYLSVLGVFTMNINGDLIIWGGGLVVFLLFGYWFSNWAKKTIYRWQIHQQWEALQQWKRVLYSILGFIVFWGILALSFYLTVTFFGGYGLRN